MWQIQISCYGLSLLLIRTTCSDSEAIHAEWRRLVVKYRVSGVQVHDTRLVAAMLVHGITHILTFNPNDFARYPEITAVNPTKMN